MKMLKINRLYRIKTSNPFISFNNPELIFMVKDADLDYHTRKGSYLLKAVKPGNFKSIFGKAETETWIDSRYIPDCEMLEDNHPAWILYGRK